ncbi:MAG: SH3 domain-containing protein [Anaerolineae bacterium]
MTEDRLDLPPSPNGGDAPPPQAEPAVETLREILFGHYRQQIAELRAELDELERRVSDEDALIAMIAPVLGDVIRRRIRDAREEMIEALYPIIGQVVVRAVSEAIRDLARTVDAQVRTSFSPQALWWRVRARLGGASDAEMSLRESLPFEMAEIFLVHRETGLLLWLVSREPDAAADADLISGMLTAIRDFTQDAFGRGKEGQLDEIEYGEWRILIEAAQHAYLAAVVEGVEPPGFRAEMRERIIEIEHAYQPALRNYDGDPAPLAPVEDTLHSLMAVSRPDGLSSTQRRVLAGALAVIAILLMGACIVTGWVWRAMRSTPTPVPVAVVPAPTSTPTFTATPSPSPTVTPSPSATSTATPSPMPTSTATPTLTQTPTRAPSATPAPVIGLMTGNVWLRSGPSSNSPRLGLILEQGHRIEIVATFGDWIQVRWTPQPEAEVVGWVPARWVGTTTPIPAHIVTPAVGP